MSAAAARRRKQLDARRAAAAASGGGGAEDPVGRKLEQLFGDHEKESMDEATAYEALQLAQSQVRKTVMVHGNFDEGTQLAYDCALKLLQQHNKVAVASQLLNLLVEVLRETHTECNDVWVGRFETVCKAHEGAMATLAEGIEKNRLMRLQCEFLRRVVAWSSDLGTIRFGHPQLHQLLGAQMWALAVSVFGEGDGEAEGEGEDDKHSVMAEAVQHMALAEQPKLIQQWLQSLPAPTDAETASGHTCLAADRDTLLTRAVLVFLAMENLRDAHVLLKGVLSEICDKDEVTALTKSYMSKTDGKAPPHIIFCCMLVCICQKDTRTGPLLTWLLKSFKRELEMMPKANVVDSYTTKIGKIYFNIQPPPSMMSMMENMMSMMGGGGGINPAMMQAALAAQGGGGM